LGKALRIPTRTEIRDVARLAAPIVVVQVGMMMMGVVDAAIVGRYSAEGLAAVALGNVYFNSIVTLGHGTLMALDPLMSQAVGARDGPAIELSIQRGLVLCGLLSIPLALLLLPGELFLAPLRQPPEVVPTAAAFARASALGVLPYLGFIALRQTVQAFSLVRPVVVAVVVGNIVNVALDVGLVFGRFGFPKLGAVGSGWATTTSRWVMALVLVWGCRHALVPYLRHWSREDLAFAPLWRMIRIGFPIGLQLWIEFMAFSVALLLVGMLGVNALAGHQIALMLAALTYMVPLGVSAAAAVLVGHAIGRGEPEAARREASAALACGIGFMSVTAIILITCASWLARVFTPDSGIIAVAATLIPIAGVFQVVDGIQGVSSGILRGAGDTRVPMLSNLAGYSVVALPLGAWLCFTMGMGAPGIWWGLCGGLAAVACLLGWRVHVILGGELRRLTVN
jgi:multidrug resistance protein, MATE family